MDILENVNELSNKINNLKLNIKNMQENFLDSKIGQLANDAIDTGLKYLLPDFLEEDVIEVKNVLMNEGLTEGINKAVENAIDLGKTAIGIFTGSFENVEQAEDALKEGGVVEGISDSLDYILEKLEKSKIISNNMSNLIKSGKDFIFDNLKENINDEFVSENKSINNIKNYINNWEKSYSEKDLNGIKNEYEKIEQEAKNIIPLENILSQINKIENVNELINNSDNFNFDNIYLDLAKVI